MGGKNGLGNRLAAVGGAFLMLLGLSGCAFGPELPTATPDQMKAGDEAPLYHIGPGDSLNIFVWRNPELSVTVAVRPDGRINTPLVEDLKASGKTPTQLARDLESRLSRYVKNPVVTVMVSGFVGQYHEQIRVVGEATQPQSLPYKARMTLLDVMIQVGGLTEFAAGNDATLIREVEGEQKQYEVRLDDLLRDGDISANVVMLPGDVLIIPEAWF